jgi:Methyltransferase small domain
VMTSTDQVRDGFVERLFASALGTMDVFTVYLGDRLGLYRILAEHGPLTASELAERAGMYARYAREWLEQQAATAILEVDDAAKPEKERRFSLPAGHAEALIDPESPYAMAAVCRSLAALGGVLPKLVDAYRTGEGVAVEGADAVEAQGDFNRPWLVGSFASEYLPQVPDVHEKLEAGARVADVACGVGWAAVSIARGYPATTVDGFDLDEPAIALARSNAQDAGVADAFQAPAGETERLFYGYSVLDCLPTGMVSKPSAETGTVMRRSTLERYAAKAGFSAVSVLPIEHDFLRFYRLDP